MNLSALVMYHKGIRNRLQLTDAYWNTSISFREEQLLYYQLFSDRSEISVYTNYLMLDERHWFKTYFNIDVFNIDFIMSTLNHSKVFGLSKVLPTTSHNIVQCISVGSSWLLPLRQTNQSETYGGHTVCAPCVILKCYTEGGVPRGDSIYNKSVKQRSPWQKPLGA